MRFQKMLDKAGVAMQTSRDGWQLFKEKNTQCNKGVSMELALVQAIMSEPENRSFDIKDGRLVTQKDKDHALQIGARLHQELTARIQGCSLPQYHIDIFGKQLTAGRPDCWIMDDTVEPFDTERLKTDASYWDEHPGVPEGATMYFPDDDTWSESWGMMDSPIYRFLVWDEDDNDWEESPDLWMDDDFMRRAIIRPGLSLFKMTGLKTRIEAANQDSQDLDEKSLADANIGPTRIEGTEEAITRAEEAKTLAREQYLLERIEAEQQEFHRRTAEYHRQLAHLRATKGGH